jgi:hypothetical protein
MRQRPAVNGSRLLLYARDRTSENPLACTQPRPPIRYRRASVEDTGLGDASIDLIDRRLRYFSK